MRILFIRNSLLSGDTAVIFDLQEAKLLEILFIGVNKLRLNVLFNILLYEGTSHFIDAEADILD